MGKPFIIELDEDTHLYKVNSVPKPDRSTTQILKVSGIVDYRGVDPYYADRGSRAHDGCELNAQGWVNSADVDDDIKGFVQTFERIVFDLGLEYVSSEELCYDEEFDVVGKYDLIMLWEGKRTLVELKTGVAPMWLGLQTASYERMVDVDDVLGISLKDGGKVFGKGKDYGKNHEAWREINTGSFDLAEWKKDRKRRHMERIL